jgi:hypothetical protein
MNIIKKKRPLTILKNAKPIIDNKYILNFLEFSKILGDLNNKLSNDFSKYKKIAVNYHTNNNNVIRLMKNTYINFKNFENISLQPDGFTSDGCLYDLFPISKKNGKFILNNLSDTYYTYIQILLNICNIDECKVYLYNFTEFDNARQVRRRSNSSDFKNDNIQKYGYILGKSSSKDIYWSLDYIHKITITKDTNEFRNRFIKIKPLLKNNNLISKETTNPSKKVKFDSNNFLGKDWIAASKTRNAALNDHFLDYCRAYNIKNFTDKPKKREFCFEPSSKIERKTKKLEDSLSFVDYLLTNGILFENEIFKKLEEKYKDNIVTIADSIEARSIEKYNDTIKEMKKGTPIIYQGILHNKNNKTFGSADLLIRSDWLNKISETNIISEEEEFINGSKLGNNKNFHYRIVDIKNTRMTMNTDGETLRNKIGVKPYKCQIYLYTQALGEMQGYTPNCGYILGNGWIYSKQMEGKKNIFSNEDPFNKLGIINYEEFDNQYKSISDDAVDWLADLNKSTDWTHDPPTNDYIYPNMCNNMDGMYHKIKKDFSKKYSELTSIWRCGIKNRKIGFSNNIRSWKDKDCNTDNLGITGKNQKDFIDDLIKFNRDSNKLIIPDYIDNNNFNWKEENKLSFYVDFETIGNYMLSSHEKTKYNHEDIIFMIGLGWELPNDNKWYYKSYIINKVSLEEENNIINNFVNDMNNLINENNNSEPNVYHWSHAEPIFFRKALNRHNMNTNINWVDLLKIFKNNKIMIKGAISGYSLKTIAKCMYNNKMIKTIWDDNDICSNGLEAMFLAWKLYLTNNYNIPNNEIMKKIEKYNEIDCKTMWDILRFLRKYYK